MSAAPGLHYEVLTKMKAKRDPKLEQEILNWISEITGEKVANGVYEDVLKDGVWLCKLMEKIKPGSIGKFNLNPSGHFKQMENVAKFLKAIVDFGVPELDIFKSDDLLDKRNIPQVTNTIVALGRSCYLHPEFKGPYFGPKPSEQNKRILTDEQKLEAKQKANLAQMGL